VIRYQVTGVTMPERPPPIAKISRPRIRGVLPRERLFRLLDEARQYPVTWISAPAGSGKTTLIAGYLEDNKAPCLWYQVDEGDADIATFYSYLGMAAKKAAPQKRTHLPLFTSEYLQGLSTFTLRYFEKLFRRLKPPSILVLDNYHTVPDDSNFHDVIKNGISTIPDGNNVIVISRHDPPPALSGLRANGLVKILGWNDLRLTLEETTGIIPLKAREIRSEEVIGQLHLAADGWVAGLVLMLESMKRGVEPHLFGRMAPEEIIDYFGNEFFNKTDKEIQDFLLRTAFLPKITVKAAEQLTSLSNAGSILSTLSRKNYFTERHYATEPVYQYHPLYRDFLLIRAREKFSQDTLLPLLRRAARLLEEGGQTEAAVSLFREAGDWDEIVRLIINHAPSMVEQGRSKPLEEWLDFLPKAVLEGHSWLLYWKGVCFTPANPSSGRPFLEKALKKFKKQKDDPGFFLSWSELVLSTYYEFDDFSPLDRWIRVLEASMPAFKTFPDKEIGTRVAAAMLMALSNRQPWHPKIEEWAQRAFSLAEACPNIQEQINAISEVLIYRIFIRDFQKALTAMDLLRHKQHTPNAPPLTILHAKMAEVIYYRFSGMHEECMQSLSEAMEISREKGIYIFKYIFLDMGVMSAINVGDSKTARELLARLEPPLSDPNPWNALRYYRGKAREALSRGDSRDAYLNADRALKLATDVGARLTLFFCHLLKTHAAHELGKHKESAFHLAQASRLAYRIKSNLFKFLVLLTRALHAFDEQKDKSGLAFLREALKIGKEEGYFDTFIDRPSALSNLCTRALEAGIEIDYVQELIRRLNIVPEKPVLHLENWPWPLKIVALGRFELLKDGKPIQFARKAQEKPLSLLKALIALGGREVKEEDLADFLWPEADGDAAHHSFEMTLHRLRNLIGIPEAVKFKDGHLTLDPRYCWVDGWAFEHVLEEAERKLKEGLPEQAVSLTQKAITMYRGAFMAGETGPPGAISLSERLRSKFLRNVGWLGHYWEQAEQYDKALECYHRGLEADDLAEELY
jgi:tetratricopeptide (TPR) repeat protein